jgi:hypothetical protein
MLSAVFHPDINFIQYRVSPLRTMLGVKSTGRNGNEGLSTKKMSFSNGYHCYSECSLPFDTEEPPDEDDEDGQSIEVNSIALSASVKNVKSIVSNAVKSKVNCIRIWFSVVCIFNLFYFYSVHMIQSLKLT